MNIELVLWINAIADISNPVKKKAEPKAGSCSLDQMLYRCPQQFLTDGISETEKRKMEKAF